MIMDRVPSCDNGPAHYEYALIPSAGVCNVVVKPRLYLAQKVIQTGGRISQPVDIFEVDGFRFLAHGCADRLTEYLEADPNGGERRVLDAANLPEAFLASTRVEPAPSNGELSNRNYRLFHGFSGQGEQKRTQFVLERTSPAEEATAQVTTSFPWASHESIMVNIKRILSGALPGRDWNLYFQTGVPTELVLPLVEYLVGEQVEFLYYIYPARETESVIREVLASLPPELDR